MLSSITFIQIFFLGCYLIAPILLLLWLIIIILGLIVGRIESWKKMDALYWAFITALTVGYGDIRPLQSLSRVLSIFIAITGIMLTGILVAITIEATSVAFDQHMTPDIIYGNTGGNIQNKTNFDTLNMVNNMLGQTNCA